MGAEKNVSRIQSIPGKHLEITRPMASVTQKLQQSNVVNTNKATNSSKVKIQVIWPVKELWSAKVLDKRKTKREKGISNG